MYPRLNASLPEAEVDTPRRGAMYLAQLAHKSEEFRVMEEIWGPTAQQASYEGRANLGNTQPGDGRRFKGRGVIQIMGRNNYRTAGEALGLPLLLHPELAAGERFSGGRLVLEDARLQRARGQGRPGRLHGHRQWRAHGDRVATALLRAGEVRAGCG